MCTRCSTGVVVGMTRDPRSVATCVECNDGYSLHEGLCVASCPLGYFAGASAQCELCHGSCRECNGAGENSCTACNGFEVIEHIALLLLEASHHLAEFFDHGLDVVDLGRRQGRELTHGREELGQLGDPAA